MLDKRRSTKKTQQKIFLRPPGVEPGSRAWEARILPLNHRRFGVGIFFSGRVKASFLWGKILGEGLSHFLKSPP